MLESLSRLFYVLALVSIFIVFIFRPFVFLLRRGRKDLRLGMDSHFFSSVLWLWLLMRFLLAGLLAFRARNLNLCFCLVSYLQLNCNFAI